MREEMSQMMPNYVRTNEYYGRSNRGYMTANLNINQSKDYNIESSDNNITEEKKHTYQGENPKIIDLDSEVKHENQNAKKEDIIFVGMKNDKENKTLSCMQKMC